MNSYQFSLAEHVEITFKPKTKNRKVQGVIWHIDPEGTHFVCLKSGQLIRIRLEWRNMVSIKKPESNAAFMLTVPVDLLPLNGLS